MRQCSCHRQVQEVSSVWQGAAAAAAAALWASAVEPLTTALQGGRQDGVAVLREDVMLQRMPHMRAQAGKSAPEVGLQLRACRAAS